MTRHTKAIKNFANAPEHIVSRRVSAGLSDELVQKYRRKSVRLRKDDVVKIVRGEYRGVEGKVTQIHIDEGKISVEGVTREKAKGGTAFVKIHASKTMVTALDLKDKVRREGLEGGQSG